MMRLSRWWGWRSGIRYRVRKWGARGFCCCCETRVLGWVMCDLLSLVRDFMGRVGSCHGFMGNGLRVLNAHKLM